MYKQYRVDDAPDRRSGKLDWFWAEHWGGLDIQTLEKGLERTDLWSLFRRWLPPGGRVLEAGCGPGHWVKFLSEHGYPAVGLDLAVDALVESKNAVSHLTLALGDLSTSPFRSESFDAYVSLGVIEHFEDGPGEVLSEALRIVKPGGVFLIAVPYLSLAKRYAIRKAGPPREGSVFYQYLMTARELRDLLARSGLRVVHLERYGVEGGLQNRFPGIGQIKASVRASRVSILKRALPAMHAGWDLFTRLLPKAVLAHMVMAVCRKSSG
jgi:SAM-dependent methyltransferase